MAVSKIKSFEPIDVTLTAGENVTISSYVAKKTGKNLFIWMRFDVASAGVSVFSTIATINGYTAATDWITEVYNSSRSSSIGKSAYADRGDPLIRAANSLSAGTYYIYMSILVN